MRTKQTQALKLELQRVRGIVGQVTGLDDEDEDNLRDAYKSIDRVIDALTEQPAQQEPVAGAEVYLLEAVREAIEIIEGEWPEKWVAGRAAIAKATGGKA